ncbi:2-succinyl-6-hydroxy-2,4-cyclohexadiene-1-carboxylate synthase [Rubrobacter tropicus]|uniref:Putative 2-succinyl-6-hydroxy-2,4-cyclohexadiene-1-carboxylate synthase n=1 Tax=Rubrobacter tropicus TaxID=2653851 RepID=A0A6G8QC52_9ACTN|nr:2-succinyl-6-hydroxy-2,4-cyclohexadiene-1-carboxylate synthase [Rubrobacter tropicus]QIN84018.1 2-succinyl-6-hydroxy-2,4-cyclohexadiene-1-carboxylate synthase [Rubrobacter tropicus]
MTRTSREAAPEAAAGLNHGTSGDPADPAVLFLHGFMGRADDWRRTVSKLDGRFFCVAVDLPGHGASTGLPPSRYTMEGAALGVLDLLDEARVRRATLVGYSMGGRLALYLALRHPDRCAGLFLESASPGLDDAVERAARRAADEMKAVRLEGGEFGEFLRDWYSQPLFAPLARDGELLRRTLERRRENDPNELAKSLRGMGTGSQPALWEELPSLRVPVLAVSGELDEKFVGISHRMKALYPGMRTAVVPGVGHNVHAEATETYLSLLEDFLTTS